MRVTQRQFTRPSTSTRDILRLCNQTNSLHILIILAVLIWAAPLLLHRTASGDTIDWQGGVGDWFDANNWVDYSETDGQGNNLNLVPSGADAAYITNGGAAQIGGNAAAFTLTVDYDSIVGQTGNITVGNNLLIGVNDSGQLLQEAGATSAVFLDIGEFQGSSGVYTLSSGSLNVTSTNTGIITEVIGNAGIGTFNQSGGTHTVTTNLFLGQSAGATGTYFLSGSGALVINRSLILEPVS